MADAGTRYTDAAQVELERRFRAVYREAQADIISKLDAHTKRLSAKDAAKRAQVEAGTLSQEAYQDWLNGQVFIGKQWKDKVDSVATSLLYANQQANDMIEGKKRAVFGENATFQAYSIEHDAGMDLSFGIYDSATVTRLIKEQPELLPRRVVNGVKDKAWNRTKIANAVTQGIIQGESILEIAQRIAKQTSSSNMQAMTRYARTAMTGAQNAGRMEMLHEAQAMGIKVKKRWLATLDSRTRDAHRNLDGQVQEIDKPFESDLGPIDYPGDFYADPANVYNCRCTLIYEYPEYMPQNAERRAYNDDRTESEIIPDMTYNEWKAWKAEKVEKFPDEKQTVKVPAYNPQSVIDSLGEAYENHRIQNDLRSVPLADMSGSMSAVKADISKLDTDAQAAVAETLARLCREYDTPLSAISTMDAKEALGNTAFAYTQHNYGTGTANIVYNPVKCGNTDEMVERLKTLRDRNYIPSGVQDKDLPGYITTHEFGHSLLNMEQPLVNSQNWVGENYGKIRKARKEISWIWQEYSSQVASLEKQYKNAEMDFILNTNEETRRLAQEAKRQLDDVRISLYSMTNSDEFIAEAFAENQYVGQNEFARRIMDVLADFRRE